MGLPFLHPLVSLNVGRPVPRAEQLHDLLFCGSWSDHLSPVNLVKATYLARRNNTKTSSMNNKKTRRACLRR
jgi:hypothetical protein